MLAQASACPGQGDEVPHEAGHVADEPHGGHAPYVLSCLSQACSEAVMEEQDVSQLSHFKNGS